MAWACSGWRRLGWSGMPSWRQAALVMGMVLCGGGLLLLMVGLALSATMG
jgi:hypothetical protein